MLNDNSLEQLVKDPTRGVNTLDLLLTNCPDLVPRVEVVPGLSDHCIPYRKISTSFWKKKRTRHRIPLYTKADWDGLRAAATDRSADPRDKCNQETTKGLWGKQIKDSLLTAIQKFIPHKTARTKSSQPWITPGIRQLINRWDRKYRKMKKTGSAELREEVKVLRRTIQRQIRRSYWKYLNSVFAEEKNAHQAGNRRSWSYIKNQLSSNVGVAPLKTDGCLTSDPKEQAELLNEQFQSVFGDGHEYTAEEFELKTGMTNSNIPAMDNININCEGAKKLLKNLNPHKAGGPDGISPRVLRELAEELAPALTTIFQSSLSSGVVPTDWRSAYVTSVFKGGEQYNLANYRPVSLTCIVCKLIEHISSVVSSVMQKNPPIGSLISSSTLWCSTSRLAPFSTTINMDFDGGDHVWANSLSL